jgi:hypothetical protein
VSLLKVIYPAGSFPVLRDSGWAEVDEWNGRVMGEDKMLKSKFHFISSDFLIAFPTLQRGGASIS